MSRTDHKSTRMTLISSSKGCLISRTVGDMRVWGLHHRLKFIKYQPKAIWSRKGQRGLRGPETYFKQLTVLPKFTKKVVLKSLNPNQGCD